MTIYNSLLDDTVDIKTRSSGDLNDWGEPDNTWTTTSDVECKVFQVTDAETKEIHGEWEDIRYKIYFKYSQTINVEDRVVYDSDEYEVVEVFNSSYIHNSDDRFKRVLVKAL